MSDPFLGEIRIFCGNFAPIYWAFCNGQLMAISQNTALFSILGTTYGGDGKTTFALPNLQGIAPMQPGQGPGLSNYNLGETGGSSTVTLITSELPSHSHQAQAVSGASRAQESPVNSVWSDTKGRRIGNAYAKLTDAGNMSPQAISSTGGSQPHNNMQPYLGVNFIICLSGIFPSRS